MSRQALPLALVVALFAASPADARKAGYRTVVGDGVKATVSWSDGPGPIGTNPLLTITRDGVRLVDHRRIKRICQLCDGFGLPKASLHVRDLDADGVPEVVVDLFSGGAHCCYSTVVFVPKDGTYRARLASWGNAGYKLDDLDGNGTPELVTTDDRFSEEFTAYAASYRPPMAFALLGQKITDVTRSHTALVADDLEELDGLITDVRNDDGDLRGLIAARMADLALLGRAGEIEPYLDDAREQGYLNGDKPWPAGAKYQHALSKFLRKTGYLS